MYRVAIAMRPALARGLPAALLAAGLLVLWARQITDGPINGDARG